MVRVILINLLLLSLPTLLYFSYIYVTRQFLTVEKAVSDAPFVWLVVTGALLMLVGLLFLTNWESSPAGGKYYPAVIRDGKIVPGHVE